MNIITLIKNANKKDLAIIIIGGLVALGAMIVDIIELVQMVEQWRLLISVSVLNGSLVGIVLYVVKKLKDSATK